MKNSLLLALALTAMLLRAQVNVFEDEVTVKNGTLYYNGIPLTGTLFSNDSEPVPNACECTLKASYRNGKLHGIKQTWYPDGSLKFKGKFANGKPVGIHLYFQNGTPYITEQYENGQLVEKEEIINSGKRISKFKNGQPVSVKIFNKEGRLISKEIFSGPNKEIHFYDRDGKVRKTEQYQNNKKHGEWQTYLDDREVIYERYENGRLIEKGKFIDNRKHGTWIKIEGNLKIEERYKNGKLTGSKTLHTDYQVENFDFEPDDMLVSRFNPVLSENELGVLRMIKSSDRYYGQIAEKIQEAVLERARQTDPLEVREQSVGKLLEVSNINVKFDPFDYQTTRYDRNNNPAKVTLKGYKAYIEFTVRVFSFRKGKKELVHTEHYSYTSSPATAMEFILKSQSGSHPSTPEEAFPLALRKIRIYPTLVVAFPVYARISKVLYETETKVKKVRIDKGSNYNVKKRSYYAVLNPETGRPEALLRVKKVYYQSADLLVKKQGDTIKQFLTDHNEIFVIETLIK